MGSIGLRVAAVIFITVLVLDTARWSHGCWDQERVALLQLKSFFNFNKGEEGSNCCEWEWGWIQCNITTRRVTQLSLGYAKSYYNAAPYSNLFNASLFLPFEELRILDLTNVGLVGCVENEGLGKLSKLRHLQILNLTDNYFNDGTLSSLKKISSLKSLNLAGNNLFTGSNNTNGLKWVSRLSGLETLDLRKTNVTNNSLLHLGGLSSLRTLILSGNNLEGTVHLHGDGRQPRLINLEEIDLSFNLLNNSILTELSGFSNLKSLNIRQNQLNGSIDVKEFCGWSNLESLDLSYNEVNQFVTSKGNKCLRKLKFLCLDGVSIKGNVSLISLLKPFLFVKTLLLRDNYYLNETVITQELHVLSNVENLIMDNTPLHFSFLKSIGILTSLKTLSLSNCGLVGTLPTQGWCYLKSLEELSFNKNALEGVVASCLGNLTSLRYLDISGNQFAGNVASIPFSNLTMLQLLSLSNNKFQVPMSFKSFANHSDLKVLLASGNKLVAEPTTFQTWSPKFQLKIFDLSNCIIDELGKLQLPEFLYYQYDLRYIDLSFCNFGGIRFPSWLLENNTRLEDLHMMDSSIVGPLFLPSHPSSNLMVLDISLNQMQQEIPGNFCSLFPNLEAIRISGNAFKSNIPPCLGVMRLLLWLDMSHNKLFGGIPDELAKSSSLLFLDLSNNSLGGKVFPAFYYLINSLSLLWLSGNKLEGEIPDFSTISSASLQVFDVSENHLSGKLPRWLWNNTGLRVLHLSKNHFEGPIPMELCNLVNLEYLGLSQNHLSGSIPSCSNLQKMKHLHLNKNKLSGALSHGFYGSSSLVTLDLSENNLTGRVPDWIGTLSALSVLLLNANQFDGEFPVHLCRLHLLSILDLSQNKLSGCLPSCLSNLTLTPTGDKSTFYLPSVDIMYSAFGSVLADIKLTIYDLISNKGYSVGGLPKPNRYFFKYAEEGIEFSTKNAVRFYKGYILDFVSVIDLSCNQLTGIIPPELGNFSEIRGLNLSHNNLAGSIPSTFSKLKQIESLDLSYNNLNGRIPPQLTELTTLEVFTVAYNNLSGPLPDRKAQFGTFDETSYEGNPLLCGLPLKNSCNAGDSRGPPSASSSEEEHGLIDMGDFYISFAVSHAIIFLATVIVLYINPYWRRAWFYFVEERSIACYYFAVDGIRRLPCFRRNM